MKTNTFLVFAAAFAAAIHSTNAQLIINGSFETPDTPTYMYIYAGQNTLAPWVVGTHSVEVGDAVGNGFITGAVFEGAQMLDLHGRLTQTFATTPGSLYTVTFAYTDNPAEPAAPAPASARVRLFDGLGDRLNQTFTHTGAVSNDFNWTVFNGQFTALQSTTSLEFTALTTVPSGLPGGIMLDAVQVSEGVQLPPRITPSTLLQNKAAYVGTPASFTVTATGTAPLAIQWRLDGRELPGQTNRMLTLNTVQPADEGDYTVRVTNIAGSAVSEPARLYVVPASTNFILRNFTNAAGFRLPYYFFLPPNYDPTRSYPLVCYFHGGGGDERDRGVILAPYPETLVFGSYKQQATDPAILVDPTRRAGDGEWTDQYLQQVSGLLDWLPSEFNIDTNRVYVAGWSAGVHATWDLLGLRPGFFAAVRILSGWQGSTPAASVKEVPLWAVHAADDDVVGVANTRSLIRALRQARGNPIYTEFSSGGHIDGALQAVCTPAVNDWLLAQRRGMGSTVGPLLSITNPTQGAIYTTGASNLDLAGSAEASGSFVTSVTWENLVNNVSGTGAGTNVWNAMGIPLQADRTNLVVVTATTASWASAFRGNTTFNDTLAVVSLPLRATLALHGSGATLNWTGGVPPYRVQRATDLTSGYWMDVLTNAVPPVTLTLELQAEFYRIVGQ